MKKNEGTNNNALTSTNKTKNKNQIYRTKHTTLI